MTFHPTLPATKARLAARRKVERVERRARLLDDLHAKYDAEPNREYADAMWGSMIRELSRAALILQRLGAVVEFRGTP